MSDIDVRLARFHRVSLPVELELGHVVLDLQSILRLREGDVLRMDQPEGAPIRVLVGGVELGFADLVTLKDRVAARIARISNRQSPGAPNGNP